MPDLACTCPPGLKARNMTGHGPTCPGYAAWYQAHRIKVEGWPEVPPTLVDDGDGPTDPLIAEARRLLRQGEADGTITYDDRGSGA